MLRISTTRIVPIKPKKKVKPNDQSCRYDFFVVLRFFLDDQIPFFFLRPPPHATKLFPSLYFPTKTDAFSEFPSCRRLSVANPKTRKKNNNNSLNNTDNNNRLTAKF
ncbi:hypothetical protein M1146_03350 [Patescibacteria group bacterium]|nr:hypothetical protein [Patescibacteria group bacterium]